MGTRTNNHLEIFMKCRLALDGSWKEVPSHFCDLLGYTDQELKEKTVEEIVHPGDEEEKSAILQKLKNGDFTEFESQLCFVDASGKSVMVFISFEHIRNKQGNSDYISCTIQNLSAQEEMREKLEIREQQFDSLFKNNPHPVYYFDHEGNFEGVNDQLVEFTGYSREELLQMGFEQFVVSKDVDRAKKHFIKALAGESGQYEIKVKIKSGENRDIRVTKFPRYSGDEVIGVYGILQDITNQKERQRVIGRSLKEKETLLKEIHHRVKNNLAMISSMLELQIMQSPSYAATIALRDSQLRIRSIGMIHEKLYQNESLYDISFDNYLQELVQSINRTYAISDKRIDLTFDLDSLSLDINQVIPCSLIVNEVIVNCYKHAFNEQNSGNLYVSLHFNNPAIELTIEDDGTGLSENFKVDDQQSLGMTLIQALSSQLEGTIDFEKGRGEKGTLFKLKFDKKSD